MLELIEIQGIARQGMTRPLICRGDDGNLYYAKGKAANTSGLIKEWMAANLAQALSLPIPMFHIAYIDDLLINSSDISTDSLGSGHVFVSKQVQACTEFKYPLLERVSEKMQRDVLLFDLWIENGDRTLTEHGGNPNLLWQSSDNELYIIDHNLAFDDAFDLHTFKITHVFQSHLANFQLDLIDKQHFEAHLMDSLKNWWQWWDKVPNTWKQENSGSMKFDPDSILQRLQQDANGNLWEKYL